MVALVAVERNWVTGTIGTAAIGLGATVGAGVGAGELVGEADGAGDREPSTLGGAETAATSPPLGLGVGSASPASCTCRATATTISAPRSAASTRFTSADCRRYQPRVRVR